MFVFFVVYFQKKQNILIQNFTDEGKFAIYNVEITQRFEGKAPEANMINLLRGKVFHADIYLERYDSTDFPAQDAPEQEWEEFLYKMFDKKVISKLLNPNLIATEHFALGSIGGRSQKIFCISKELYQEKYTISR